MKRFRHAWTDPEDFILHVQVNNPDPKLKYKATVVHELSDGRRLVETWPVTRGETSFRFMVSRAHPLEERMVIEYPAAVTLEAYKLDDRAFYPTAAFFVG